MKVKAKAIGFYDNKRVKMGAEFFLKDAKHFDPFWMVSTEPKKETKKSENKE